MNWNVQFTVTNEHLLLLRRAVLVWEDGEFGAPAIDPKRPYGNGDAIADIYEILGWEIPDDSISYDVDRAWAVHEQTFTALEIALVTGAFEEGTYEADRYSRDWRKIG